MSRDLTYAKVSKARLALIRHFVEGGSYRVAQVSASLYD